MKKILSIFLMIPALVLADRWAEEHLAEMTLKEKVGQLFVAPLDPMRGEDHWADWTHLLQERHIGNVLMKASEAASQIALLEKLQAISRMPLLVAADAEWGLAMRMKDAVRFPKNMTLGAIQDLSLLERMGRAIGRHAAKVGVHLNLAPVADVNSNPLNPVIHMRSFGEDPKETALRVEALVRGMRAEGLFTCAKHFPGHGDTHIDSHKDLPVIEHDLAHLREVEFPPFQAAIAEGVECIMNGHLLLPALDFSPASLSPYCLQKLLRGKLGFKGLVVSDALNMRALTNTWKVEEIALRAFQAGNDLLLYGAHLKEDVDELMKDQVPRAYDALYEAFEKGELSIEELDWRVLRILSLKEKKRVEPLSSKIVDEESLALKRELYRAALTLRGELPKEIRGYVAIGGNEEDLMVQKLREKGVRVVCYDPRSKINMQFAFGWVVGVHRLNGPMDKVGEETLLLLEKSPLAILFCSPYLLQSLPKELPALIAYENDLDAQEAAWDALHRGLIPTGKLPILRDF